MKFQEMFRDVLVRLGIPPLYQRIVVWWHFHSDLRDRLKAFRVFMLHRGIALRDATLGSVMLVANRQIQSRDELRDMSAQQIMRAWRDGRMDFMTSGQGVSRYGHKMFQDWVANGGQIHPSRPSERR